MRVELNVRYLLFFS